MMHYLYVTRYTQHWCPIAKGILVFQDLVTFLSAQVHVSKITLFIHSANGGVDDQLKNDSLSLLTNEKESSL